MKNMANKSRLMWTAFVLTLVLGSVTSVASAQVFVEDFESYAAGSGLVGQGGWKGYMGRVESDGQVSDVVAHSGRNSIELIPGSDLIHEYDISGGKWLLSMRQYIPLPNTGLQLPELVRRHEPVHSDNVRPGCREDPHRRGSRFFHSDGV